MDDNNTKHNIILGKCQSDWVSFTAAAVPTAHCYDNGVNHPIKLQNLLFPEHRQIAALEIILFFFSFTLLFLST